jgi:hypothetical protein
MNNIPEVPDVLPNVVINPHQYQQMFDAFYL